MYSLRIIILSIVIALAPISSMASAPDLKLKDLSGGEQHLSQLIGQGQWTVVVLWAEDCEVCNAEIQSLDFFHDEHKNKDARILGISIDGEEKIKLAQEFVKRHDLSFPNLLIEPDMRQISKLGGGDFIGTPTFYIYTPEGEIVASQAGAVPVNILEDFINNWEKK
jgi:peroxiredoxin